MLAKSRPVLSALSVAAVCQERGSPLLGASRPRYAKGITDGADASFLVFIALPPTMVSRTGGNGGGVESAHVPCGRGAGKAPHPRVFSRDTYASDQLCSGPLYRMRQGKRKGGGRGPRRTRSLAVRRTATSGHLYRMREGKRKGG